MENNISGDANIAAIAVLMSEPPRAAMLAALADGRAFPAGNGIICVKGSIIEEPDTGKLACPVLEPSGGGSFV